MHDVDYACFVSEDKNDCKRPLEDFAAFLLLAAQVQTSIPVPSPTPGFYLLPTITFREKHKKKVS